MLNHAISSINSIVFHHRLDMTGSMNLIAQKSFPKATKIIDRFHVQKLAHDAVQQFRIQYRWGAIASMKNNTTGPDVELSKQDTLNQLLARSRYLLLNQKAKLDTNGLWQLEELHY